MTPSLSNCPSKRLADSAMPSVCFVCELSGDTVGNDVCELLLRSILKPMYDGFSSYPVISLHQVYQLNTLSFLSNVSVHRYHKYLCRGSPFGSTMCAG